MPDANILLSGYLLFRDFCLKHLEQAKPLVEFYEEVRPDWPGPGARGERKGLGLLIEPVRQSCAPLGRLTCGILSLDQEL